MRKKRRKKEKDGKDGLFIPKNKFHSSYQSFFVSYSCKKNLIVCTSKKSEIKCD